METMSQVAQRGWKRWAGSIVLLFMLSASLLPGIALANPGYPHYKYEGLYPTETPCSGRYFLPNVKGGATRTATFEGRKITLKYYYNPGCGSFARVENAPSGRCEAWLDRSDDDGSTWATVKEPVDTNINFAFTKVGNNLQGRLSRAALICNGDLVVRTNWY